MSTQRDSQDTDKSATPADKTPNTDMQPEDTGTASSGDAGDASQARAAMKQTSKTSDEAGDKGVARHSDR